MNAEDRFHQNTDLAYYIVRKYYYDSTPYQDLEDLYQVAMIGLWRACLSYDESKGIKFSSYASRCIYNEVGMYLRPLKKNKGVQFISYEDILEGTEGLTIEDTLGSEDEMYPLLETRLMIESLDERDRKIIELKMSGLDQSSIGKLIGYSQSVISRKMKSIKNKLAG